jgi:aminotransferase
LISDEVYKDFIYDGLEYFSLAHIKELRNRVIRLFSFSKSYAMTGWRVGYLHTDDTVAREILKVHDTLVTCAPVISQYAAMGALEMGEKDLGNYRRDFLKRRDLVCSRLDELNEIFSYSRPNSAYFVFPKIINKKILDKFSLTGESISWNLAKDLLDKVQVALVPGLAFGPESEGYIRVNFGRSEEHINEAFDRMKKYFSIL